MLDRLKQRIMDWQQYRIALRRLRHLDDRLLADLGARRETLDAFVTGRAKGSDAAGAQKKAARIDWAAFDHGNGAGLKAD